MNEDEILAEELHHQVKRKFQRRRVIVTGIDEIWALDLASMESLVGSNDGYKYILCIIDVFSKYAWAIPLKTKTGLAILGAVKDVVAESERQPKKIWVDRGSEFYNRNFKEWAKDNDITIYSTYGDSKSVVVERFIRTLRQGITRKLTATHSHTWIKFLPNLMKFYNNKLHKTICMTPEEASNQINEVQVYNNTYHRSHRTNKKKQRRPTFHVGDRVRISRIKGTFEKGSSENWTREIFTVTEVLHTDPITYKLKDAEGEEIVGSFYTQELLKTKIPHMAS